ncbi:MAG: nucleoside hydrolase [Pseudomonadota bacterium]
MYRATLTIIAVVFSGVIAACSSIEPVIDPTTEPSPVPIIFDTDFGGDADDLGAVAMLHYYADQGDIDLLAIVSWSHEAYALSALAAVNQFYGRPDLQLGVREVDAWRTDWNYNQVIAEQFPHDSAVVEEAEPAVTLYRRLLADATPNSITVVTVGPLANIQNLLRSEPDAISDLTGAELVAAKVDQFVIMGGQFPEGITAHGPEWNFDGNMEGVTQGVLESITRPVIFSGYEVGEALKYGDALNAHPSNTPLYVGYKYFSEHAPWMKQDYRGKILDNSSFDQTAVMYAAINGVDDYWTLSPPGTLRVDETGIGTWTEDAKGRHRYLLLTDDIETTVAKIAEAMTH